MTAQEQSVGENATAIQAGGNVTVGITPAQIVEMMSAMGKQLAAFGELAQRQTNERLALFERDLLERFSAKQTGNVEAFGDPDFQQVLRDAQKEYVRSDDDALHGTLVDLVAKRSFERGRSRLSLTLNRAVERAAFLTKPEFAEIALAFLVEKVVINAFTIDQLLRHIRTRLLPLAADVSSLESSYIHIESIGCGRMDKFFVGDPIEDRFVAEYQTVLSKGFDREELEAIFPNGEQHHQWLIEPHSVFSEKLSFRHPFNGLPQLVERLASPEIENFAERAKAVLRIMSPMEAKLLILDRCPEAKLLFDTWEKTQVKYLRLNTTGIAIAHAYASRTVGLNDSPLSNWIR